jgi:hypothetical protein
VTDLVLTGAVIAGAIILGFVARYLKREPDTVWELVIIAFGLVVLIWTPAWFRSLLVGGFAVACMVSLGTGFVIVMLGIVIAAAIWLPGGVSVLLFVILAVIGINEIRSARRHLVRIARADALVVNQPVEHEVELTGTAHAVRPTVDPVFGGPCALWRVTSTAGTRDSDSLVEIRGANGSALIEPTYLRMQFSRPAKQVTGDEAARAGELLKLELDDAGLQLYVLPEGADCYVVGQPQWTAAPANVGMYRDGNVLPTFGTIDFDPALFVDRSEAQLRSDHAWAIASWSTWSALCAAIAVIQIGAVI